MIAHADGALMRPVPTGGRRTGTALVMAVAVAGSMLISASFGPNIALVDPVLGLVIGLGLVRLARGKGPAAALGRACAPWIWLIVVGSVLGLVGVGLTSWALDALARDIFCFALLFAVVALVAGSPRILRASLLATVVSVGALSLLILGSGGAYRPAGTFENPNYAAHYLVMGAAVLYAARFLRRDLRAVVLVLTAMAIVRTGSFGAVAMGLAGGIYVLGVGIRRHPSVGRRIVFVLLVVALGFAAWRAYGLIEDEKITLGSTITSYRLSNSSNVRSELWADALGLVPSHPIGVGPYGIYSRSLLGRGVEVHNDVIAYLVERGLVGLIGLVGLAAALWRRSPHGGAVRLLVVMVMVGGLFRETLHFRHAWIFLGVGVAVDLLRRHEARTKRPERA